VNSASMRKLQLTLATIFYFAGILASARRDRESSVDQTCMVPVQVDLILMGEHYRRMLEQGVDPLQQARRDSNPPGFSDVSHKPDVRVM